MGTDQFSRDVLARVLSGARISLEVATLAVAALDDPGDRVRARRRATSGGRIDAVMMRVLDGFLSIPRVMLVARSCSRSGIPSLLNGLILLLGATGWFGVSRLVRAETLSRENVDLRRGRPCAGTPRHANSLATSASERDRAGDRHRHARRSATSSHSRPACRISESARAEPTASWGSLFNEGAAVIAGDWWLVFFPGLAIVVTVLAFNVLGDALRDVLDPRQLHGTRGQSLPASLASAAPRTQSSENG